MTTDKELKNKSQEEAKAERERYMQRKALEGKYKQRFTIAKEGKLALNRRDYRMMIYRYNEYLKIVADTYEVPGIYDIKPESFDVKKDVAELLLISQIYWELSKLYDGSSKSGDKLQQCLNQFVRFTLNMQFQGLNSEIVRKELKRRKFKNKEMFQKSLEKIYRESSGCYLATYYQSEQDMLQTFRTFKKEYLNNSSFGRRLVYFYYEYSPRLILLLKKHPKISNLLSHIFKPGLKILFRFLNILGVKNS